jgi:hypothetical protein
MSGRSSYKCRACSFVPSGLPGGESMKQLKTRRNIVVPAKFFPSYGLYTVPDK